MYAIRSYYASRHENRVITPHPGEAARLLDGSTNQATVERLFGLDGLGRKEVTEVACGDIV